MIDGKIDEAARFTFDLTEPTAPLNETNPEVVDTLRRILELFDVGFVHIHHLLRWPLAVVDLLIESKLPVAYTAHDFLCTCPSFNMTEYRVVMSQWLKQLIERKHGVACHKIHMGLDLGVFRPRSAKADGNRRPQIVYNARPDAPRRGFSDAIKAFARVHVLACGELDI